MRESFARATPEPRTIYDEIAIEDVRNTADVLRPVYESSRGADGFVSLEPPPQFTADTKGTIQEARRLHGMVNRPNLMIKVVATKDGVTAVDHSSLFIHSAYFVVAVLADIVLPTGRQEKR